MFITFEGIDGCGKTTQLHKLADVLSQKNIPTCLTREPGGTHIGAQIRSVLLNVKNQNLCAESELLLYLADRIQHLQEKILSELQAGKIVLCDRFHDATIAYQGYGRGLDLSWIQQIEQQQITPHFPQKTFLFDLPPETALQRIQQRTNEQGVSEESRIDQESITFFGKVAQGYRELAQQRPERFITIDASQSIENIHQQVLEMMNPILAAQN